MLTDKTIFNESYQFIYLVRTKSLSIKKQQQNITPKYNYIFNTYLRIIQY